MPQEVRFILKMSKQNPEHLYKKYFIQNKKSQGRLFQLSPHPHLKGWADFLLGKTNKTPYFWKKKRQKNCYRKDFTGFQRSRRWSTAPLPQQAFDTHGVACRHHIPIKGPPPYALGGCSKKGILDEEDPLTIITWEAASRGKQLWEEPDGCPSMGRFTGKKEDQKVLPCLG